MGATSLSFSWNVLKLCICFMKTKKYSNALVNITRRLIGYQQFATVYSTIYHQKPDIMIDVAGDWSM